jgi:hypothetical protein
MKRFMPVSWWGLWLWLCLWLLLAQPVHARLLDDFKDATPWRASASDQVKAALRRDADGSLCLDADFAGVSGYAVMRRELPLAWPAQFDIVLRLKSAGATNDLQFKLVDDSGDNVWWVNRPNAELPQSLAELKWRRRHLDFAWGPASDRTLRQTRHVELVLSAGRDGGRQSLCLAGLSVNERQPDPASWPRAVQHAGRNTLDIDFGLAREFNGVELRWPAGAHGLDYELLASEDARRWRVLRQVSGSDGGLDALFLPDSEARHLRVRRLRGTGLPALALRSAKDWPDFNRVLSALAADAPRGQLPRAFIGEQNYWTLVGVDGGGARSGLISEDGALELGRGGPSVEPSVQLQDGQTVTWADVELTQHLRDTALPLPSVTWRHAAFSLMIEAAADGPRDAPELLARYRLLNTGPRTQTFTLLLALRPWQVNPPQQFLATPGGARRITNLQWADGELAVDGHALLRPESLPQRISALPFDGGLTLAALRDGQSLHTLHDPQQFASAALHYRITLAPGEARTVGWVAPLGANRRGGELDARIEAAAAAWRQRLGRVVLDAGPDAQPLIDTLRTSLAHILMSRDGAALQPGTRSYARTWIRDGAMMVAGLLRLGETEVAREFVDAFAERIFDSGKVPCCVGAHGADPVVENDSHGQYLYAVAEVWRHTRDTAWLARHWTRVQRVVAWQEALRQSERKAPGRLFGLMPPSISHEGYSDKPAYSYWDDFWALRGYKDGVVIARALGHADAAATWATHRDEFEQDLATSITATAAHYRIDTVAGAADRGDFDATSTTVALDPAQARIFPSLLAATFERYWQEALARSEGRRAWRDYTPYELRNVGALLRLGQAERAHAMLRFFFKDQRPAGWNQWAEVVLPNPRETHFLGDMPHAWVSSDFIRSALDLFAYEREADATLLIGAGWKTEWLDPGITLRGLSTSVGTLDLQLKRQAHGWTLDLQGPLRGAARLAWPGSGPLPRATLEGQPLSWEGRELPLPPAPARLLLTDSS